MTIVMFLCDVYISFGCILQMFREDATMLFKHLHIS